MPSKTPAISPRRPKRSLGQNFLHDQGVVRKIVDALYLTSTDSVVEIGPGRGALTDLIAERAGRLTAVEMDDALAPELAERYAADPTVTVVHADALEVDLARFGDPGEPYKLVGNLPFNVASPIIRRFLQVAHKPALMVVMVQREVADSMAAVPGEMTYLSVEFQLRALVRQLFTVRPTAFRPRPKVTSAVVAINPHAEPPLHLDSEEEFLELVRAGFSARRKQIHNSLKRGLGLEAAEVTAMLEGAGIDASRRAQTLSLAEWGALYAAFREAGA